jgi:hypothetical protein
MIRHSCWRAAELFRDRDLCRYEERLTDSACAGCALRKPAPLRRRAGGWLDRQRQGMEDLKKDLGQHNPPK